MDRNNKHEQIPPQSHSERPQSHQNPNPSSVLSHSKKLNTKPLWRLFKVLYAIAGIIVVIAGFAAGYNNSCYWQFQEAWNAVPDPQDRPLFVPCDLGEALPAGIGVSLAVIISAIILFLAIRRMAVYVVYGVNSKK